MVMLLLDLTSIMSMRVKSRNVLDAAMLSLAVKEGGNSSMTKSEIVTFLQQHIDATQFPAGSYNITSASWDGVTGAAQATFYAGAPMMSQWLSDGSSPPGTVPVQQQVAVKQEIRGLEAALVLDVTGSMASSGKIDALRPAAADFVNIVFTSAGADPSKVKIGVVPFVATVNVKAANGYFEANWVDPVDPTRVRFIEDQGLAASNGKNFNLLSGSKVSHTYLYQKLSDATGRTYWYESWKGCVESRPPPYDTQDLVPTEDPSEPGFDPNTLWTAYFWPDEPDFWQYANNWLPDFETTDAGGNPLTNAQRQMSLAKYLDPTNMASAMIDEIPSNTLGPNASCPSPILPLTSTQSDVLSAISALQPWNGGGTQVWQGVMWAWRVLSPEEPFPEGVPYTDTTVDKYMIVMSDGDNAVVNGTSGNHNVSHYTGANYRLSNFTSGTNNLNTKMLNACTAAKDRGIRVVTIGFRVSSGAASLLKSCASNDSLYYNVDANEELQVAFQVIAKTIARLRMTK